MAVGHGGALVLQGAGEDQHVVVDDLGPPAEVARRGGGLLDFQGLLPGFSLRSSWVGDGERGEEHGAHTVGAIDPGQRAGEQFELEATASAVAASATSSVALRPGRSPNAGARSDQRNRRRVPVPPSDAVKIMTVSSMNKREPRLQHSDPGPRLRAHNGRIIHYGPLSGVSWDRRVDLAV
jgi:hypothetical protein